MLNNLNTLDYILLSLINMVKYIVLHNKHEGCYDFQCYQDEVAKIRLTSITINPPKLYMFDSRSEAQDFFEEYINDVDCTDIKCKKSNDEVEHVDYCTCGVIELDDDGEPILFYNKKNQIFLLEHGPQVFVPKHDLKNGIKNLNLTNRLIRKCKSLDYEQRKRYIELGKYCEECNSDDLSNIPNMPCLETTIDIPTVTLEFVPSDAEQEKTNNKNTSNNNQININILDASGNQIPIPEKKKRGPRKKKE